MKSNDINDTNIEYMPGFKLTWHYDREVVPMDSYSDSELPTIAMIRYVIMRVRHVTSIVRNDFLYSIHGEQVVRTLLKTENILQRLLKSMPTSSSRIFFWIPSSYVHFVTNN